MVVRLTERGFAVYAEFTATYGEKVRVQESSAVDPHVWIFTGGEDSVHLNPDQARELIAGLEEWLSRV